MFQFIVTPEGGLTKVGYLACIAAGIALFMLAIFFAGKSSEKKKMSTKQLVFCGIAMALAFVTSYNETPRSKLRGISPRLTSFVISLLRSKLRGIKPSLGLKYSRCPGAAA